MKPEHQGRANGKRSRRTLVLYVVGIILLTDVMTIVFLRVFSGSEEELAPAPSIPAVPPSAVASLAEPPAPSSGIAPVPAARAEPTPTARAEPAPTAHAEPAPTAHAEPMPAARAEPVPAARAEPVPATRAVPRPRPNPDAAQEAGQVLVTSTPPGATLRVNGEDIGITPMTVDVPAGGRVLVTVMLNGHQTRIISLRPWEERVRVRLKPDSQPQPPDHQDAPARNAPPAGEPALGAAPVDAPARTGTGEPAPGPE